MNYYNEFDPQAAQWLRNLIAAGLIPAGDVDERSIEDVIPNELRGYTQCHFFAGIAGWSLALDLAGWPRDRPVWTGSCPCQPFSAAGKGDGFKDERHLWPAFQHLIAQCRPSIVFGEQVASKATDAWVDLVHADLENMGYAFGCIPFSAASIGAPHIRDRNYWVANANDARLEGRQRVQQRSDKRPAGAVGVARGLAYPNGAGSLARSGGPEAARHGNSTIADGRPVGMADTADKRQFRRRSGEASDGRDAPRVEPERLCDVERVADSCGERRQQDAGSALSHEATHGSTGWNERQQDGDNVTSSYGANDAPGPTNGFWRSADWLLCRDGKWRPVEPGTFPLAHGVPARVVRLRAYGNSIVPQAAAAFIRASMIDEARQDIAA